jgi:hypothetical protein
LHHWIRKRNRLSGYGNGSNINDWVLDCYLNLSI